MTRTDELKAKFINGHPEKEKLFEAQSKRLDTASRIVELRKKYDLSQRKFIEKAGIAKSTITRIENAEINPTVQMLWIKNFT